MTMEGTSQGVEHPAETAGESVSEETQAQEASEPEVEPWRKVKHRVKVDGVDHELDYDELLKGYGMQSSLTKKQQAVAEEKRRIAEERQALQSFFNEARDNPKLLFELAQKLGHDPRELAEAYAWEKLQYEQLSDEQREALEAKRERDELKRKLEERERSEREARQAAEDRAAVARVDETIDGALKSLKLKPTPQVVARLATIYQTRLNATERSPSVEELVRDVKRWVSRDIADFLSEDADLEELEKDGFLPEYLPKRMSQHYAKKLKPMPAIGTSHGASSPKSQGQRREKIGVNDWIKTLGSK